MKKEIVFVCKKCEHHLFLDNKPKFIEKLIDCDCPNCGEEGYELWIFQGYGSYKEFIK